MNATQRRYGRIYEIGCICCRRYGHFEVPCMVHHLNLGEHAGQVRMGDFFTIGLCAWHHVGHPEKGLDVDETCAAVGPSMQHEPVRFREVFGSDMELLAEQNRLIAGRESCLVGGVA